MDGFASYKNFQKKFTRGCGYYKHLKATDVFNCLFQHIDASHMQATLMQATLMQAPVLAACGRHNYFPLISNFKNCTSFKALVPHQMQQQQEPGLARARALGLVERDKWSTGSTCLLSYKRVMSCKRVDNEAKQAALGGPPPKNGCAAH